VSAYARPGHRCWHNLNYWEFGDYLGIGAGAHSKLSFAHRVVRQVRFREPKLYMEQRAGRRSRGARRRSPRADLPFEFMLNALRLKDGFALAQFTERTGLPSPPSRRAWHRPRPGPDRARPGTRSDLQALFLAG
jgi:coproporphyrinogen III oxidase-like Fe-S oxidoreductase